MGIEARLASEENARKSSESEFLACASGFDASNTQETFRIASKMIRPAAPCILLVQAKYVLTSGTKRVSF